MQEQLPLILSPHAIPLNPNNPRSISDPKLKQLVASLKEAPWMLNLRPIVLSASGVVLGGNMRVLAAREAGLTQVPVIFAPAGLTPAEEKEFIIKDNLAYGEWDWPALRTEDWDLEQLEGWGLIVPDEPITSAEDPTETTRTNLKVEVICKDSGEQERVYQMLLQMGYNATVKD